MSEPYRPTVLVDFDGVIHRYSKGWHDGTAYDEPNVGAKDALKMLEDEGYNVVIFSTRDREQILPWLSQWGFPLYPVTCKKLPAVAIIDDRAITFNSWFQSLKELRMRYPIKKEGQQ